MTKDSKLLQEALRYYRSTKMVKMGKWALLAGDCETWHGEATNAWFKKTFGIPKGLLDIQTHEDGYQHMYAPSPYFNLIHKRINLITKRGPKALEKILTSFYSLRERYGREIKRHAPTDPSKLTNKQLAKAFLFIRKRIQHLSIFDQFTWLSEEYWTPLFPKILQTYGLQKDTDEYRQALFALIKPERISTTLAEKRDVLKFSITVKKKNLTAPKGAERLARTYGWLPVFTYGTPWTKNHYEAELREMIKRPLALLEKQYAELKNYGKIQKKEKQGVIKKLAMAPTDVQPFTDFGLAIDTRNEAEYFVGYGGYFLLPLYREIARRLYASEKQIRLLWQQEMLDCLLGKKDIHNILYAKGKMSAMAYTPDMRQRIHLEERETKKLFDFLESRLEYVQGNDESQGTCASPGKAVGTARIVPSPQHNHKVKDGDILITYATTTDYLPAMKRAAAIITEVGGLTCHAAVVSREFNIPCIVALKNAMKNIPDGTKIEVDADKGIIRKL